MLIFNTYVAGAVKKSFQYIAQSTISMFTLSVHRKTFAPFRNLNTGLRFLFNPFASNLQRTCVNERTTRVYFHTEHGELWVYFSEHHLAVSLVLQRALYRPLCADERFLSSGLVLCFFALFFPTCRRRKGDQVRIPSQKTGKRT